ncbi:MAG: hypothetical protein HYW49_04940 [Deltaproteobacteria bacterium]|nr:hypothetical protein [Deltaproteobacteria bacterium]
MNPLNLPRWDGTREGFYEVWYFKLNHAEGALWLRLTLLSGQVGWKKAAEAWGIFFKPRAAGVDHVAVKRTLPLEEFSFSNDRVAVGKSFWSDGRTAGAIRSGANAIEWDLSFEPSPRSFEHVPRALRALKLNRSTVVTPNPDLRFHGVFRVNGVAYACDGAPGMQGHIHGSKNADSWAWAHSNIADDGAPFVFECLTARLRMGGLALPLLSAFYLESGGQVFALNSLRDAIAIRSSWSLDGWEFHARKNEWSFNAAISAARAQFAGVRYEDTNGSSLFCHNSKVSSLDLEILRGGKLERRIRCSNACAYEVVSREKESDVRFLI